MSIAVVGTDTGVGKTLVSTLLMWRYCTAPRLAYWKPISTGSREGSDLQFVEQYGPQDATYLPEAYRFEPPVSPHLAARLAGEEIEIEKLARCWRAYTEGSRYSVLVEGIGGLLVPLTSDGYLLADFLARLRLPCVLVASTRIGTINHTLLSLEAARARGITVVGIITNGPGNPDNDSAVARFGEVAMLGSVEPLDRLCRDSLRRQATLIDPTGVLEPHLEGR